MVGSLFHLQHQPTLICTVAHCRSELTLKDRQAVCENGHSFDIARSGYLNLLQPQDRRSKHPGDSVEAVAARRRLHDAGMSAPLLAAISNTVSARPTDTILDVGCGEGFYLGSLTREASLAGCGTDISVPAIDAAARRYPECQWIVANADRFLPFADGSFSVLLSITSRMQPLEFWRVLTDDGRLLIALPAPDDLIQLRGPGRDRSARTVEEFSQNFELLHRERATSTSVLNAAAVQDVLLSIYRPLQSKPAEAGEITFSLDLLLFRKRWMPSAG